MESMHYSIGQPIARLGNIYTFLCLAGLLALHATSARASDPNGVYAFVDKVVFEPSEAAPERIQVWGGFAVAREDDRDSYQAAQRGYTYFKLRPGDEAICKKEWADLKSIVGTKQIVAFGSRYDKPLPKVRKPEDKPEQPDAHPKSWGGIIKVSARDHGPVGELTKLLGKANSPK